MTTQLRALGVYAFVWLFVNAGWAQTPAEQVAAGREATTAAVAAYRAGDDVALLRHLREAHALRSTHPTLLYNLAIAYVRNGQPEAALTALERYAAMGLVADPASDDDLAALYDAPRFEAVVQALARNALPVGEPAAAFRLDDERFIPEGLAFDPVDEAFYVGSVYQRRIVRVTEDGRQEDVATAEDGLWSVLGLALDAERRRLWAVTTALDQTAGLDTLDRGRSALVGIDLRTGAVDQVIEAPGDGPHNLGDIVVLPDGEVVVADGRSGALYRLPRGGEALLTLVPPGVLSSPQGMIADGPAYLLVADYALGLTRVARASGAVQVVAVPDTVTLLGTDGLARHGKTLLVIQNGVRPHRVLRLTLSEDGSAVTSAEVLAAALPVFDEPTLGTVVGDAFYVVANSQWGKFDRTGALPADAVLAKPLVVRIDLAP